MTHDDYIETLTTARQQQIDIAPLPNELGGFRVGSQRRTWIGLFGRILIYCPAQLVRCSIERIYRFGIIRSNIKERPLEYTSYRGIVSNEFVERRE